MKLMTASSFGKIAFIALALLFGAHVPAALCAPESEPASLRDRVVSEYLAGKWDVLSTELAASAKEIAALSPGEKLDVEAVRKAVAECRPAWWKICKAGEKVRFKPIVWGHTINGTFDPTTKSNVNINYVNGVPNVTLSWDVKDMDNPAEAEHGFTKGELNDLAVWSTLGTAQSWTELPLRSQANLDEPGKMLLSRYLGFRGIVTSAYYGNPRARRWGFWLGMWAYNAEHAKDPTIMSRKAIGAMFIAEVLSHRTTYPSVKFPSDIPTDDTEARLTPHLKDWLGNTGLTFAEDNSMREALKLFAATNEIKARTTGKVILPNSQTLSFDPVADKTLSAQRDAWIKNALSAGK